MINIMIILLVVVDAIMLVMWLDTVRRFMNFRTECRTIIVVLARQIDKISDDVDKYGQETLRSMLKAKLYEAEHPESYEDAEPKIVIHPKEDIVEK